MLDTAPVRAFLDDTHMTLAERVSDFATRLLAPLAEPKDDAAARHQARELLAQLGTAGWFQPIRDQDWRACCIVREALAAASPLADAVFALQALGVVPMLLSSNDTMRKRWLDAAIQGRAMASFAMTEPEAGSDAASLGATAEPDGDGYLLSGTKTFISNAGIADFYTVFATTDRAKKDKGIGCFVVPADTPGVRLVRPLVLSSPHPLGEIAFQKARVPAECRLDGPGKDSSSASPRSIASAPPSAPPRAAWRRARSPRRWRMRSRAGSSGSRWPTSSSFKRSWLAWPPI